MNKCKAFNKFLAKLLVLIALIDIAYVAPVPVKATADAQESLSSYLKVTAKYLYLGKPGADTFDFDIKASAQKKGAVYTWYVVAGKGNPGSVTINKKTGIVTAKEAGTAYIKCKIKYKSKTVIRPEAKVIVRNNITEVKISNLPENMSIFTGIPTNFNRTVCHTQAGAGIKTEGITRWEIAEDKAEVGSVSDNGIVYPVKAGTFKLRAICFESRSNYLKWLNNKNKKYITAASDWYTMNVVASDGKAIANTQEQLNKALAYDDFTNITLSTKKAQTIIINSENYSSKSFYVNAPNADVENHGIFKDITIEAIKDTTWIEYANGNIVHLLDNQMSFIIESSADVKQIVINAPNSVVNLNIKGKIGQISVLQPSKVTISGSSTGIPILIDKNAGGSTIITSILLNMTLNTDADIVLQQGAEGTSIDKSARSIKAKIDNQSKEAVIITVNKSGKEVIEAGVTGLSNEATSAAAIPTSDGGSNTTDTTISVTGLTISPSIMILSVSGSAMAVSGGAMSVSGGAMSILTAVITPDNASEQTVIWSSVDESVATVDSDGVVTPIAEGTTSIVAAVGSEYASAIVKVVSGSALAVSGGAITIGKLKSVQSAIATGLLEGAASYIGSDTMGWGLTQIGLGHNDPAAREMIELYKLSVQLNNLEDEMTEIKELIKQSEYDSRMTALEPVINNIKNIQDEIKHYLNYDKYDEAIEKQIHSDIHDYMMKNKFSIYQQLVGTYGKVPLLKIWSSVVAGRHRFLSKEDSAKVQEMFDCFMKIQEAELYLLVEYYHTQASYTTQDIVNLINEFYSNIEEEQKLLLPSIPENVLIDREQNIMIYGGYYYSYNAWGKIKIRKIQGPWRGDFEDKDEAINKMCYSMNYNNWRVLTYDEFMNMFTDNDLNPFSIAYLQDEGWVTPPLKDGMELVLDNFMFPEILILGNSNSTRDTKLLTDIYENFYYWLTVRSMDKNEMSQYFWK